MDSFINLAKQGYQAYSESQSNNVHQTGGAQFNSPDNTAPGSQGRTNIDHQEVINSAQQHGSGASDLFHTALSFVNNNQHEHEQPVDEESVTQAHKAAYNQEGGASNLSANALGSAAAMQVLKQFTSGGSSGGSSQSQLISMAMAEATKLFDKSGGGSSGSKQEAVNGAAMTVMKLLVQSKFSGAIGGGNSGGLSGLLSMASKFA